MRNIEVDYDDDRSEYTVIDTDLEKWLASFHYEEDADEWAEQKRLEP